MSVLYISKQTEAEKDQYLLDCFYDSGVLAELLSSKFTILTGRKGSGKSAVARYLEKNFKEYGLDFAYRLSIRSFNATYKTSEKDTLDSLLFYVVVKTVQKLLESNYFSNEHATGYWKDFLTSHGLQQVQDYESFVESKKTKGLRHSIKARFSSLFLGADAGVDEDKQTVSERALISNTPSSLFNALGKSLDEKRRIIVFIDDISDYLDESSKESLITNINVIKDLLLRLQALNHHSNEQGVDLRFVALIRDDLFEFMEGSNVNKLKSDSLSIEWNETDFASLLVRRMPFFENDLDKALHDPVEAIQRKFPDSIFTDPLKSFNTNRYRCNFYAYMAAISFNRPRDFLQFGHALRNRLPASGPASFENIQSAEIEYTDYFFQELRDELYLASRVFGYELTQERINLLVDIMSAKDNFNSSQLKTELGRFIDVKTSLGNKKIEILITELWRYGVIGVTEKADRVIRFKYLSDAAVFTSEKIKQYVFYLHRGLWWFARKYRK